MFCSPTLQRTCPLVATCAVACLSFVLTAAVQADTNESRSQAAPLVVKVLDSVGAPVVDADVLVQRRSSADPLPVPLSAGDHYRLEALPAGES